MTKVIAVRMQGRGKIYYCTFDDLPVAKDLAVVVETDQGPELALCTGLPGDVSDEFAEEKEFFPIIRLAEEEDLVKFTENREAAAEAYDLCKLEIAKHELPMVLVEAEYNLDRSRLLFYFTADGRVDFRLLVRDLAATFRTRIELRQIGVRDEASLLGGLGICGRELCCASFLDDFHPVSIKMAKDQNLSMNPAKISGACGRLLCCLRYEEEAYKDANKRLPRQGDQVRTSQGRGIVEQVNLLKETLRVRLEDSENSDVLILPAAEVEVLSKRKPRK